jgi:hypothetical protein
MQRPLTSGPRGWPSGQTPLLVGPAFQPLVHLLHGHALHEVVTRNLMLEVGGSRTWWLPGHVARPANTWHVTNLIKLITPPWTSINTPMLMEFKTPHSTYSSPLVKVPV